MGDTMSDIERNEIIYEEGWRDSGPIGGGEPPLDEEPSKGAKPGPSSKPLLISIQLAVCVLAAGLLFILKAMDSPAYHGFMTWYKVEMNRTLISRDFFDRPDIGRLSSPDEVTVRSSPDEFPLR